jgi:hypothetical protein
MYRLGCGRKTRDLVSYGVQVCALLGICHRSIRANRTPDRRVKRGRKAFPMEVKTVGDLLRTLRIERGLK